MGGSLGGSSGIPSASLQDNLDRLRRSEGVSQERMPGTKFGKSRRVYSANPQRTADRYFEKLSSGGTLRVLDASNGSKITISTFSDDSHVTYRRTSSDGSPVIEISINGNRTKFHFVGEK